MAPRLIGIVTSSSAFRRDSATGVVVSEDSPEDILQDEEIADNLRSVKARIAAAAQDAGREASNVTLVAVSKGHAAERSRAAIAAGHRVFGENRVQEAATKFRELRDECGDLELHLVGSLQTNKVRQAVAMFDVIQSLDRPKLAEALAREMYRQGRLPSCFIEVNTGNEPQKSGVMLDQADHFIDSCLSEFALPITGLMCIPPAAEEPSLHFALLGQIAARHGLDDLSTGMSADFEIAVAFGATHVRVGTAIFGQRPSHRSQAPTVA